MSLRLRFFKHNYISQPAIMLVNAIIKALQDLKSELSNKQNHVGNNNLSVLQSLI